MSRRKPLAALVAAALTLLPVATAGAAVTPATVTETIAPGDSVAITKTVDVPESPPKADVYFLADTTGSMGSVISSVRSGAATMLGSLQTAIGDAQFGAGDYKDFPLDDYAFANGAGIAADDGVGGANDASDAIAGWSAIGGGDGSEGQLFALDQIARDPAIGWRDDSNRVLVWFGDAPGHDPVCAAISGLPTDITEASATAALVDAGVTVVAISTTTGFAAALDANPTVAAGDYTPECSVGGSPGQATRIADATGGVHVTGIDADTIVDAILDAIESLTFTVSAEPVGCGPLDVSFAPAAHSDVAGGSSVQFEETVAVPAAVTADDLPADGVVDCTVNFRANDAVIGTQELHITVPLPATDVPVDIHPTSCPNPVNLGKGGVVPAALLGTADLPASGIDPATVELIGPGGSVAPLRSAIADVAGPDDVAAPEARGDCGTDGPDGHPDLTLKFPAHAVASALGDVGAGDVVVLEITAETRDGTAVAGSDIVWVRQTPHTAMPAARAAGIVAEVSSAEPVDVSRVGGPTPP